jgi:hypothetical protein
LLLLFDRFKQVHLQLSYSRQVYGEAWEGSNGAVPIRELVKIPDSDVRAMQMEAQAIVTARKEEEKQDLW